MSAIVSTRTLPSDRVIVRCLVPSPASTVVSVSTPDTALPSAEPVVSVASEMACTLPAVLAEAASTLPASVCEGTLPLPPFAS